jgi:hypothetical protein
MTLENLSHMLGDLGRAPDYDDYGRAALYGMPPEMEAWGMGLELPHGGGGYGEYVLVDARPASIEMHHQVTVVDESNRPRPDVWVVFGFPGGGPDINLKPSINHWRGAPSVLKGNAQRTDMAGSCLHTFGSGGEDTWVWDINREGILYYPSPIVKSCNWVGADQGPFIHSGVHLIFQLRRPTIYPESMILEHLLTRIETLETHLGL